MNNIITKPISFQVGQSVVAQLGNEGNENYCVVSCKILGIKADAVGNPLYLVKPENREDMVAVAFEPWTKEICEHPLYSTDARIFGKGTSGERFGFLTEEQSRKSLGF